MRQGTAPPGSTPADVRLHPLSGRGHPERTPVRHAGPPVGMPAAGRLSDQMSHRAATGQRGGGPEGPLTGARGTEAVTSAGGPARAAGMVYSLLCAARAARPAGRTPRGETDAQHGVTSRVVSDEAREGLVVARPFLENSTACRKSVPSNAPCRGVVPRFGIPLVD